VLVAQGQWEAAAAALPDLSFMTVCVCVLLAGWGGGGVVATAWLDLLFM